mgnify:CR=1 FL=1|tara:strand:- start:4667 stop:5566 length:900 start_codon:yes stop_codon:yes gene_type:complete
MFKSYWIITVALGLTFASLAQAQEQDAEPDQSTTEQQTQTIELPNPLPVIIIEDDEATATRQREESERTQREKDDLVAQQGMNTATQSIEAATRDMRDYALYSTFFVAIGTIVLFYTLWLTRQANSAALYAVKITEKIAQDQVRPWVTAFGFKFGVVGTPTVNGVRYDEGLMFSLMWQNTGNSPAIKAEMQSNFKVVPFGEAYEAFESEPMFGSSTFAPQAKTYGKNFVLVGENYTAFLERKLEVILFGRIDYKDSINPKNSRFTEQVIRCSYNGEENQAGRKEPLVEGFTDGPQNNAT